MDIGKRITRAQARIDRQEVSHLLALSFEEVVEWLAGLRPERVGSLFFAYLHQLNTEALIVFVQRIWRMFAAWDLGVSEEELADVQYEAWYKEQGYPQSGEVIGAMGPSFETD